MIVTGGENVYPAEVEAALDACPGVRSCAVIGLPDADLGQRIHAIVEGEPALEAALRAHLASRLARFKIPRSFEFVATPLRDDAGKVRRVALRAERVPREVAGGASCEPRRPRPRRSCICRSSRARCSGESRRAPGSACAAPACGCRHQRADRVGLRHHGRLVDRSPRRATRASLVRLADLLRATPRATRARSVEHGVHRGARLARQPEAVELALEKDAAGGPSPGSGRAEADRASARPTTAREPPSRSPNRIRNMVWILRAQLSRPTLRGRITSRELPVACRRPGRGATANQRVIRARGTGVEGSDTSRSRPDLEGVFALSSALAQSDREARFAAFASTHRERALRLAWRLVGGDAAAAEDVTQDAFVKALRGLARFRDEAPLSTWFYRILVRQAYSYLRWRRVRERFGGEAPDEPPDPP